MFRENRIQLPGEIIGTFRKLGYLTEDYLLSIGFPLAILLVFTPFFPGIAAKYGIEHPAQAIAIYMGVIAIVLGLRGGLDFKPHWLDILFVSLVVWITGSLVFNGPADQRLGLIYIASAMLVPYAFARLMKQSDIEVFIRTTVSLALILVPVCILGIFILGDYNSSTEASAERLVLFDSFLGPGTFGLAIGMLIPLCVISILFKKRIGERRLLAWVIISSVIWAIVALGARSIFISGFITALLILIFARRVGIKWRIILGAYLLICAGLSLISFQASRIDFFSQLLTKPSFDTSITPPGHSQPSNPTSTNKIQDCYIKGNSVAIRYVLYSEAIDLFLTSPLTVTGVGAGNFGFHSCFKNQHKPFASPHGTVLHVLTELGLIGGVLFLGIVLIAFGGLLRRLWRDGFRGNLTSCVLTALWTYYFIVDQFSHSYFTVVHFFLLAGVIASQLANNRLVSQSERGHQQHNMHMCI